MTRAFIGDVEVTKEDIRKLPPRNSFELSKIYAENNWLLPRKNKEKGVRA